MGSEDYYEMVRKKLGAGTVDIMLKYTTTYKINAQKMADIAQMLGSEVGGKHNRRMEENPKRMSDGAELREILCDWYNSELFGMETEAAQQKLRDIFNSPDVDLKPLAKEIKSLESSVATTSSNPSFTEGLKKRNFPLLGLVPHP